MVWWILVLGLVAFYVAAALRWGAGRALGIVVPITWLLPAWLMLPVAEGAPNSIVGSGLDIKVTVGAACLILYCFIPGRTFPVRWIPSDFAVAGLILAHLIFDTMHDGFALMTPLRAYAEWYLPYVAGRLAIQSAGDVRYIWRVLVAIGVGLAIVAIAESLWRVNIFESIFGERPVEGFPRDASRWKVRRAFGPTMHPIYFGVVQLLLLGWAAYAALLALKRRTSAFWVFAVLPIVGGIVATASRGPILGVVVASVAFFFFLYPKARLPIGGFAIVVACLGIAFREPIINQLEQWSGELQTHIEIEGESRLTSGTRTRVNMLEVNKIAIKRSGLTGFGSDAVAGFPINVPLGPMEVNALKSVRAIDNTYVLLMLRFGYVGAGLFFLAGVFSVGQYFWISQVYRGETIGWLTAGLGSVTFAALLVQATVWMPHEIGFPLLWTFGISGGILVAHLEDHL